MSSATSHTCGTRPRTILAIALGLGALALMHFLVSASVLAVNFTTGDKDFKIYSNYVQGLFGAGYMDEGTNFTADRRTGVAEVGFKSAALAGFCAISTEVVPGGATVSLIILGGVPVKPAFDASALTVTDADGVPIQLDSEGLLTGTSLDQAVTVSDMFLNTRNMTAFGNNFSGLNLGQSADQVGPATGLDFKHDKAGSGPGGGEFGLSVVHMNLSGLTSSSYGIELAGQVKLPKLHLRVKSGTATQADCTGQTP